MSDTDPTPKAIDAPRLASVHAEKLCAISFSPMDAGFFRNRPRRLTSRDRAVCTSAASTLEAWAKELDFLKAVNRVAAEELLSLRSDFAAKDAELTAARTALAELQAAHDDRLQILCEKGPEIVGLREEIRQLKWAAAKPKPSKGKRR